MTLRLDPVGARDPGCVRGDLAPLPFTHGVETECFLATKKGNVFGHGGFEKVYRQVLNERLKQELQKKLPEHYSRKVKSLEIAQATGSTYDALYLRYESRHGVIENELISVDRNVAEWPLLELATPPCETAYEIAWWSSTLHRLLVDAVRSVGTDAAVLNAGVGPYENMEVIVQGDSFPTCGEHHHIAFYSDQRRAEFSEFYHMLRLWIPNFIMLGANSPFASGKPTGKIRLNDHEAPFPRCARDLRVMYNFKHMCNFHEGEYMPFLKDGWRSKEDLLRAFNEQTGSFRKDTHFLDYDPISRKKTTEVRVFDSGPSTARRVGIALLLQAMAVSALKPPAEPRPRYSMPTQEMFKLKRLACESGGWCKPPSASLMEPGQAKLKRSELGRECLSDHLLEMLGFLRPALAELQVTQSRFLAPLRASVYGAGGRGLSPAEYWLVRFARSGGDMKKVAQDMLASCERGAASVWYDPLVSEPAKWSPQAVPRAAVAEGEITGAAGPA
jgi:hypothetical protein